MRSVPTPSEIEEESVAVPDAEEINIPSADFSEALKRFKAVISDEYLNWIRGA